MKRSLLVAVSVLIGTALFSQPKLHVTKYEHDFGTFREEDGRQAFNFEVVNSGTAPLVIHNIAVSCGCTAPTWTKNPISPNGKGVITAVYDPTGRAGAFNQTLTVYTNARPEPVVLVIKGEVKERERTTEELYTWQVGQVRFESNHLAFTTVKKTEKKTRVMPVINTSKENVKIDFDPIPPHVQLKATPEVLKPGQKGVIEGTYDATKNNNYGTVTDIARVRINGVPQENMWLYLSANLTEDFSHLSKADLERAPVFRIASATVDLGEMPPATTKEVVFPFTNGGKSDLIIRHVRSTCGCTAINQSSNVIKPGESGSVKATFNSGTFKGRVTKAIYVYTNDPSGSEVVLMLNANVLAN